MPQYNSVRSSSLYRAASSVAIRQKPRPFNRTSTTPSNFVARPSSGKSSRASSKGLVLFRLAVARAASSSAWSAASSRSVHASGSATSAARHSAAGSS
jgi:hypothetical protein